MRSRGWASFWTILAATAGVVGAGAAVYPLLQPDQHAAHITFPFSFDRQPYMVRVVTLSDPVVLTGRWYIRRASWWNFGTLTTGTAVAIYVRTGLDTGAPRDELRTLKDVRIGVNEGKYVDIDGDVIREWAGGSSLTNCDAGEFEIGIEYKWKGGTSWARMTLPLCVAKRAN